MFVVEVKKINPFSGARMTQVWLPIGPAKDTRKDAEIAFAEYRENQPNYANRMRIREV